MIDDAFEREDDKAASNLRAHKVTFEMAREAFSDAFYVAREDRREPYGQVRYNLIGMAAGRLLHVTYALRMERIRIISARPAEPRERSRYHEQNAEE
jgi:uncharacterized protein